MKGSSAEENGNVLPGDAIVSVDGMPTETVSVDKVRNLIVGPQGEKVHMVLRRDLDSNQTAEVGVVLTRGTPDFLFSSRHDRTQQRRDILSDFVPMDAQFNDMEERYGSSHFCVVHSQLSTQHTRMGFTLTSTRTQRHTAR